MSAHGPAPAEPTAPLHVLHAADREFFARFGRMFRQVALGLSEEGVRVSLLTDDAHAAAALEASPVACRTVPSFGFWSRWSAPADPADWFDPLPAAVHVWSAAPLRLLERWSRAASWPLLLHATTRADALALAEREPRAHERLAAICEPLRQILLRRGRGAPVRVELLRPALLMSPGAAAPRGDDHTLSVLWTGVIDDDCGVGVLIDAASRLQADGLDLQLVLMGTGPALGRIWRHCRARNVQHCVSLVDGAELWDQTLGGCDALVVTSAGAEVGLAPLLAMALGKIVIVPGAASLDWFVPDETVWVCDPFTPAALAQLLTRVAAGGSEVRALAARSRAFIRTGHSVTRLIRQLLPLYLELAGLNAASAGRGVR